MNYFGAGHSFEDGSDALDVDELLAELGGSSYAPGDTEADGVFSVFADGDTDHER